MLLSIQQKRKKQVSVVVISRGCSLQQPDRKYANGDTRKVTSESSMFGQTGATEVELESVSCYRSRCLPQRPGTQLLRHCSL